MRHGVRRGIRRDGHEPCTGQRKGQVVHCPADAISFGDLENKDSAVYKLSRSYRASRVMEDLGVEPKVYYLSKRVS